MDDILFLAHRIPFPPDRGDKMRSWHMLRHLAGLARVHLACFADDEADAAHLGALRAALGGRLGSAHVEVRWNNPLVAGLRALATGAPVSLTLFDSPRLRRFVSDVVAREPVGTIFAFSSQMAQFVPLGPRFVMDFVDMDSAKFADYAQAGGPKAWLFRRESQRLFAFERATAARADSSLFVSEAEAALFRDRAGLAQADISAVGNGIDLSYYDPAADFARLEPAPGPLIVFTGQMDYRPNVEAVAHFAATAFPRIRAAMPDVRFAIVGRNPVPAVQQLASRDGVLVTGSVADVRSWLAAADVVVAPLLVARGIQNKVLEAMAMGRPVVASQPAFEGIEALPGRDLLVADDPVEAVTALLADPDRRAEMGTAARRRMEIAYRWEARLAPLTEMLRGPERQAAE
jgi:sugar transferase (PEP-CTERM/EpsH1 system associated)